jgi:FkbM family methyltransferase
LNESESTELIRLSYEGLRIVLTSENIGGYYSICFMGGYDPVLSRISQTDVVVDGGANVGIFSLLAARKAKVVYAIEPNPRNFELLLSNLESNGVTNVVPIRGALSDREGRSYLRGSGESGHLASEGTPVRTLTIDSITKRTATCIKLDVEGATMLAMRGVSSLRNVLTICFEVEQDQLDLLRSDLPKIGIDPGSYDVLIRTLVEDGYRMSSYNELGVHVRKLLSFDLVRAELSTSLFATRAFLRLLLADRKNLFYPPSLRNSRIDTLYFLKNPGDESDSSPMTSVSPRGMGLSCFLRMLVNPLLWRSQDARRSYHRLARVSLVVASLCDLRRPVSRKVNPVVQFLFPLTAESLQ